MVKMQEDDGNIIMISMELFTLLVIMILLEMSNPQQSLSRRDVLNDYRKDRYILSGT